MSSIHHKRTTKEQIRLSTLVLLIYLSIYPPYFCLPSTPCGFSLSHIAQPLSLLYYLPPIKYTIITITMWQIDLHGSIIHHKKATKEQIVLSSLVSTITPSHPTLVRPPTPRLILDPITSLLYYLQPIKYTIITINIIITMWQLDLKRPIISHKRTTKNK